MKESHEILDFWFEEIDPSYWFSKDLYFDEQVRTRFFETYKQALTGKTSMWRSTPRGRLAEVILLDQFPRNMFRDKPESFASDSLALHLSKEAVRLGEDQKLSSVEKSFLYMPYMHSEDRATHIEALHLFSQPGLEYNLKFELKHKVIIDRFGRYPHRNRVLGRASTAEEIEFLKGPDSSF